jgi:hypothetical protein
MASVVVIFKEEDYPGAIQLCLECQNAASTFKHYSCIRYGNKKILKLILLLVLFYVGVLQHMMLINIGS